MHNAHTHMPILFIHQFVSFSMHVCLNDVQNRQATYINSTIKSGGISSAVELRFLLSFTPSLSVCVFHFLRLT